jgi:uncharacterized integral membrane protein
MNKLKWILLATLLTLSLVVIFQNLAVTQVRLIFATFELSQAALLMIMLATGYVLGISTPTLWRFAAWRAKNKKAKQVSPSSADANL